MRDRRSELGDTEIVVVTFTNPRNLAGYRHRFAEPLTVTTDPTRAAYRAFGFGRGRWWRIWGIRAARRWAALRRAGGASASRVGDVARSVRHEDTLQLGGDVVVDPAGRIAWSFHGAGPDDRPTVEAVIAAVRAAADLR